jgi:hypothetical protein
MKIDNRLLKAGIRNAAEYGPGTIRENLEDLVQLRFASLTFFRVLPMVRVIVPITTP